MKIVLVGSRAFGAAVLRRLLRDGHTVAQVFAPSEADDLAVLAGKICAPLEVSRADRWIEAGLIPDAVDLIVTAQSHAFVTAGATAKARLGGIGYHPSLLPRHRGRTAVESTIAAGDAIAGGSVYQLTDTWDAGPIAAQEWCFVRPGETARELWRRALFPMGCALLADVAMAATVNGGLEFRPQDEEFATRATN